MSLWQRNVPELKKGSRLKEIPPVLRRGSRQPAACSQVDKQLCLAVCPCVLPPDVVRHLLIHEQITCRCALLVCRATGFPPHLALAVYQLLYPTFFGN